MLERKQEIETKNAYTVSLSSQIKRGLKSPNIGKALEWFLLANRNDKLISLPWKYHELIKSVKEVYRKYHDSNHQTLSSFDIFNFGILLALHDQKAADDFNNLASESPKIFDECLMKAVENIPHALAVLQVDVREIVFARITEQRQQLFTMILLSITPLVDQPFPPILFLYMTDYLINVELEPEQLLLKIALALVPSRANLENPEFFPNKDIYEYIGNLFNTTVLDMEEPPSLERSALGKAALNVFVKHIIHENEKMTQLEKTKSLTVIKTGFFSCCITPEAPLSEYSKNCRRLVKMLPKKLMYASSLENKNAASAVPVPMLSTPIQLRDPVIPNAVTIHDEDRIGYQFR